LDALRGVVGSRFNGIPETVTMTEVVADISQQYKQLSQGPRSLSAVRYGVFHKIWRNRLLRPALGSVDIEASLRRARSAFSATCQTIRQANTWIATLFGVLSFSIFRYFFSSFFLSFSFLLSIIHGTHAV
jgi:hypothetical protein